MKFFYYDTLEAKKNKLISLSIIKCYIYYILFMICIGTLLLFISNKFLNTYISDLTIILIMFISLAILFYTLMVVNHYRKKISKYTYCLDGTVLYRIRIMRSGFINSIIPGLMDEGRFINIINHYNETQEILSYDNLGLVRVKKYCNVSMYKNKKKCIILKYNNFNLNKKMKIPKCYKNIEKMFN